MRKKVKFCVAALLSVIVMSSQAFAVTYTPNVDEDVKYDKTEALDEYEYTEEDVEKILKNYTNITTITEEEFIKYDLNNDGVINANDAAIVLDCIR